MAILGWYPPARTTDHYVFLNTLSVDNPGLYAAAKAMTSLNSNLEEDPQLVFKEGIEFLRKAAASERQKELAFLNKHGLPVSNIEDIEELIRNINKAKMELNEFENRVKEEKARRGVSGTGGWSFTQGLSGYISSAKNQMKGAKGTRRMNTVAGVVRSALIKQYNSLAGSVSIDQLATIVGTSQSFIMGEITRQVTNEENQTILPEYLNKDGRTINQRKIEELIKKTDVYKRYIEDPSKNFSVLMEYSDNILSKYGYGLSKEAKDALKKIAGKGKDGKIMLTRKLDKNGKDIGIDWNKVAAEIPNNSEYTKALENISPEKRYTINIVGNTGMGGEARIYNDIQNAIIKGWTGKTGGKIDLFEVEITDTLTNNNALMNYLDETNHLISQRTQSEFQQIGKQFSKNYQEIDNILKEAKKEQDDLSESFILHYNVKDYVSTNTSNFSGFEGGDYKGLQFIEAIAALQSAGFASADIDFLTTCFINTAEDAVGASNKEGLERYFSLFATMMLFDDGRVIAEQAANKLTFDNLNVLHIFPLNGIYVPSSVVMTMVANELENAATMEAAKVSINPGNVDFSAELQKLNGAEMEHSDGSKSTGIYGPKRWESIRETQIAAMSARIRFLANFSAIIDLL